MKTKYPSKAILLAAGYGTRIQPLSDDLPKPMMPIWGKPSIAHMINLMKKFGVREILINLHHNAEVILNYFNDNPVKDVQVEFSYEPHILGTGGAIRKASWFIQDADFWVVNTDIVADISAEPFLREFGKKDKPISALWLHPELGPRTVEMKDNRISCFHSKHPGKSNTYTFCGLQLLSPAILRYLPKTAFSSTIEAYSAAMSDGHKISGISPDNTFWFDIGTISQYIDAHRQIIDAWKTQKPGACLFDKRQLDQISSLHRRGVTINGFAAIGSNVAVASDTKITDSVLWDNVTVRKSAQIKNAILARNSRAQGPVFEIAIQCDKCKNNNSLVVALASLGWQPSQTTAIPLGARGSARSFTRLINGNKSAIYIHYSTEREENLHYAEIAQFLLENQIPVPRILFDAPEICVTVMEDLGSSPLEEYAKEAGAGKLEAMYYRILRALNALHTIPVRYAQQAKIHLQSPFSPTLYKWERQLLEDHLLTRRLQMNHRAIRAIMNDLEEVAHKLTGTKGVLLHRDMQSSNIFIQNNHPYFVDFQGLRLGPPAYDVASLLCDPYVMLSTDMQDRLLDYYASRSANRKEILQTFWYAAVQRLAQALGAYGRLSALPGTERFAGYIKPAITMMARALNHISGLHALKALTRAF
ncbi:MAG: hypothetical protein A2283_19490 [Lentisphaerae bacterium RIFOXYA12_FULL_48_11]|nr:MAG: hypothetical protein A2283_19490 [Lentisphaerae bacterium RIFOXYA12_FULL_48_11]